MRITKKNNLVKEIKILDKKLYLMKKKLLIEETEENEKARFYILKI